jgi:hypothetical protein
MAKSATEKAVAEVRELEAAQSEIKPLPDKISLPAAQWVSLTALRNSDAACLQEIGKHQAEIKALQAQMQENQGMRLEILDDLEVAFSIPPKAFRDYQFVGKELVKP